MQLRTKRYLVFIAVLILAPILRELFFGIVSHHHQPFSSLADVLHTLSEVVVMGSLGVFLVLLDLRFSKEKYEELKVTQTVAIEALASLAEYRDAETAQHLHRIRVFVQILAKKMQTNPAFRDYLRVNKTYIEDLAHASVLHDIGKIAVPDRILLKPGKLTDHEFDIIKTHTTLGSEILGAADRQFRERIGKQSYLTLARAIAQSHHEKWNGSGYPEGLAGENIPLAARIVAVCDVYDAVTSDRVYKKAWSHEQAIQMIKENSGLHFDPVITGIFLEIHEAFQREKISIASGGIKR